MAFTTWMYNLIDQDVLDKERSPYWQFVYRGRSIPDALLLRSYQLPISEVGHSVLAVARAGSGTNNIPVDELTQRGIPVFNAPGANANAVAELTIGGMLMAARNIMGGLQFIGELEGADDVAQAVEAGKKQFAGFEVRPRTIGIVGLGAIGGLVAQKAIGLGMRVIGHDPQLTVERALSLPSQIELVQSLEELLVRSDFVSLHVPLIKGANGTEGLIDQKQLARMKPGSILLNFARGEIVDNDTVLKWIDGEGTHTYVSDFPTNDLIGNPSFVAMPHLGASTDEAEEAAASEVIASLKSFLLHGNVINSVNFPNISSARSTPYRLIVTHRNIEGMLALITDSIAHADVNIEGFANQARGDIAHTLIDLSAELEEGYLKGISCLHDVLRARLAITAD